MSFARDDRGGALISVKVVPGARRDQIVGPLGDELKVRVSQPPEGGKANAAVRELLAARLGIAAAAIEVVRGHTSPRKVLRVEGLTAADVLSRCQI